MAATIANVEMAAAWDGDEGDDWARDWERYDRSARPYHQRLLELAAPQPDTHVLDIGCGNGQVARDLARLAPAGRALGIDLSRQMLAKASELAAEQGIANAAFVHGDAQVHPFESGAFDLAVSRFGAMFFADPHEAFGNVARALRPGGRVVLVTWQRLEANPWLQAIRGSFALGRDLPAPVAGAPGPLGLADPELITELLTGAGFTDVAVEGQAALMSFGADADDALAFLGRTGVARGLLGDVSDADRRRALEALREHLVAGQTPEGAFLASSAWLTTATRKG